MKTNIRSYVLSIWLTSVMLSPVIVLFYVSWTEGTPLDKEIVPLMLTWGGACSIPSLLLLGIACYYLVNHNDNVKAIKIWLTIIGLLLTCAPFWVLNDFSFANSSSLSMFFLPYSLTIVAGIWFYKLKGVGAAKVEHINSQQSN